MQRSHAGSSHIRPPSSDLKRPTAHPSAKTGPLAVHLIGGKRRRQLRSIASGKMMKGKCMRRARDPAVWPGLDGNFTLKRNEARRRKEPD